MIKRIAIFNLTVGLGVWCCSESSGFQNGIDLSIIWALDNSSLPSSNQLGYRLVVLLLIMGSSVYGGTGASPIRPIICANYQALPSYRKGIMRYLDTLAGDPAGLDCSGGDFLISGYSLRWRWRLIVVGSAMWWVTTNSALPARQSSS